MRAASWLNTRRPVSTRSKAARDDPREQGRGHGGKTPDVDLRLSEDRAGRGQDEVADPGQLAAASETATVHRRYACLGQAVDQPEHRVERLQHLGDPLARVVLDRDPGRKRPLEARPEHQCLQVATVRERSQGRLQGADGRDVEHVYRRAVEGHPERAAAFRRSLDRFGLNHARLMPSHCSSRLRSGVEDQCGGFRGRVKGAKVRPQAPGPRRSLGRPDDRIVVPCFAPPTTGPPRSRLGRLPPLLAPSTTRLRVPSRSS